ncbi:MAG: T9SS type A sorting domain-containing protein [Bacteroidetes bacterium]|nr:MAG: T9SS type A sorting domain-containing protein [Bacteroidota bacterium]
MFTEIFWNRLQLNITVFIVVMITSYISLHSQIDTLHFDTKGTDFWLTFPPNYHIGKSNLRNKYDDSLYIFITSDKPTSGKIEYIGARGVPFTTLFSIPDPTRIFTFSIFYEDFELLGFNNSGSLGNRNNSEIVTREYFHITSDYEVTAYAHNQANMTSDACLILPTDILGNNYFIMSYNSDGNINSYSGSLSSSSTPSQFVILATEDNTNVTIIPKQETQYNNRNTQNILLNKGEAYLVQAKITISSLKTDLTGSEVHSDKPVAVFAGHQRSTLPNNFTTTYPTRDYLLEQMPAIETWGQNALIIPYQQPYNITSDGSDKFRILSANDNTKLYINDVFKANIDKGEFYEDDITGPAHVKASAPVLVAQFKQSSDLTRNISNNNGDPFEMLIPPVEQFMNNYRVINTQANQYSNAEKVYEEQYITIVAPNVSLASVRLDGNPIPTSNFLPVPTSNYFYTNERVSDGVHTISCNEKIGVYVYGYGDANSYGYVGGMSMERMDVSPPQFATIDSCFSMRGVITDTMENDSKIYSVISPPESQVNVTVKITSFNPYASLIDFSARLNNFYDDGEFEIIATDSMGLYSTKKFEIPGFTLSVMNFRNGTILPELKDSYRIGKQFCYPVVIENYGKHRQNINDLILKNNNFSIIYNTPKIINPGETDTVMICFSSPVDTVLIDTLSIVGDCGIRKIQAFNLSLWGDSNKPAVKMNTDPCNKVINITVSDSTGGDFGLASVDIIDTVNCLVTIDNYLPQYENFRIEVIDQCKDAIYHLVATDSAGFVSDIIDTIQGFTIAFPDINPAAKTFEFDCTKVGIVNCQKLRISNTGLLPFTFDRNMFISHNIIFSIPQSNIPLTLNPGSSEFIDICFAPYYSYSDVQRDTFVLEFNCISKEIYLSGIAVPEITASKSNCNIPVIFTLNEIPLFTFLGQNYPNPTEDNVSVKFGVEDEGLTSIRLFDLFGNYRQTVFENNLKPGIYELKFSTENLEQGAYIYILSSGGKLISKAMIVKK